MKSPALIHDLPGALALACAFAVFIAVALDRPDGAEAGRFAAPAGLPAGIATAPAPALP